MGFYGVYSLSMSLYLLGILYGLLFVKEDRTDVDKKQSTGLLRDFFAVEHVKETFRIVFKQGENKRRTKVILIIIAAMFIIAPVLGTEHFHLEDMFL